MASKTSYTGNYTFSNNGVVIPDTTDILETVQNEYREALGEDLSLEESTPQGRLIDVETTARVSTISFCASVANVLINISMSSGSALDAWGANFDIPRNGATSSRVPVIVTGVPNTVIPANSEASTANGVIWLNESEIIIGADGTAQGFFVCFKKGAIALGVGELTNIVASSTTGINGWETITNPSVATLGSEKESDASYKRRILNSIFFGTALFGNYTSACYKVDGVTDVYAMDNPHGLSLELDNITIPPHSVFVCVNGGNSEEVAKALYTVKSAGCGWCGNTTVTIFDENFGTTNTVTYQIPVQVQPVFQINLSNVNNTSTDLKNEIVDVIINYFSNFYNDLNYPAPAIRGILSPFTISNVITSQISGITINDIKIGLLTPAPHAIPNIKKASVTGGITWASIVSTTFASKVTTNGIYNFVYTNNSWKLGTETIIPANYGISITGSAIEGDIISVLFANGELSSNLLQLFASEIPVINSANITVNING